MLSQRNILDHGFVELHDVMGNDQTICESARVSFANEGKITTSMEDFQLLDYLIRNDHGSPLEMVEFRFKLKIPLFLARQVHRHRTFSINEYSGRYTELDPDFFTPESFPLQSKNNKQGRSEELHPDSDRLVDSYRRGMQDSHGLYHATVASGVAKELARINLPLSTYTVFFWKGDLRNLLNFLRLRLHPHAQAEARVLSKAILDLIRPYVPLTISAWENQVLNAVTFSSSEMKSLLAFLGESGIPALLYNLPSDREKRILKDKLENYTKHYLDIGE